MIITQPKNGYRYNSDTMFLYDFIREGGVRGEVLEDYEIGRASCRERV